MTEALRIDNQLCFALHAASRAMTGAYQSLLADLDVTYPQYLVLMVLWEEDGARVSRIGERLHLDSATLTPLLKRLEARGLVERRRGAADERVVEVFLTRDGKKLERKAAAIPKALLCKSGLSLAEVASLRDTLRRLTTSLRSAQSL
jgi:DNA-binding MarR family transcriptional regulator